MPLCCCSQVSSETNFSNRPGSSNSNTNIKYSDHESRANPHQVVLKSFKTMKRNYESKDENSELDFGTIIELEYQQNGWEKIINIMVDVLPLHDMTAIYISYVFDNIQMPDVSEITRVLDNIFNRVLNTEQEVNICVVLVCIAARLSKYQCTELLSDEILEYLTLKVNKNNDPRIILFALIALDCFIIGKINREKVVIYLKKIKEKLIEFKNWNTDTVDFYRRQVGFEVEWLLMKVLKTITPKRALMEGLINIKISADGLELRNDVSNFEYAKGCYPINQGIWYYEVMVVTTGLMQIGWASKRSLIFKIQDKYAGIGDDDLSVGYDGQRGLLRYGDTSLLKNCPIWRTGDIVGCLLNFEKSEIHYTLNGTKFSKPCTKIFKRAQNGYIPAVSLDQFQQCRFNFGSTDFKYPPINVKYTTYHDEF